MVREFIYDREYSAFHSIHTHHLVDNPTNDLWKYGVNANTWTWMSGVNPSVRQGKYGEIGKTSVENIPAARTDAIGFYETSKQELWVFGGAVIKTASTSVGTHCNHVIRIKQLTKIKLGYKLSDLWRYGMNDSTWTWISGSDSIDQPGVYGEKGNASSENVPSSRNGAVGWYDSLRQELWLFGGYGYGNDSSVGAWVTFIVAQQNIPLNFGDRQLK